MITSKFESDISDKMKKKWNCTIEVKPGAIRVIPNGYDSSYPVNLSRDKQFIENSKIFSWTFNGKRYDIGTMKDWFQSHLELSANSEFAPILNQVIKKL